MKTALILALALATCAIVVAPTASACPDPEMNPCDPPPHPIDPFGPCNPSAGWKGLLGCYL